MNGYVLFLPFNAVAQSPDTFQDDLNGVAGHEINGGLACESHTAGCSGKNYRTGQQGCAR